MVHPPSIFSLKCRVHEPFDTDLQIRGQYLAFGDPGRRIFPPSTRISGKLAATAVSATPGSRLIDTILNRKTAN
jgi:hypothetical protein